MKVAHHGESNCLGFITRTEDQIPTEGDTLNNIVHQKERRELTRLIDREPYLLSPRLQEQEKKNHCLDIHFKLGLSLSQPKVENSCFDISFSSLKILFINKQTNDTPPNLNIEYHHLSSLVLLAASHLTSPRARSLSRPDILRACIIHFIKTRRIGLKIHSS